MEGWVEEPLDERGGMQPGVEAEGVAGGLLPSKSRRALTNAGGNEE